MFYSLSFIYFNEISSNLLRSKVVFFTSYYYIGTLAINIVLKFVIDFRDFFLMSMIACVFYIWLYIKFIESPFFVFLERKLMKYKKILLRIG